MEFKPGKLEPQFLQSLLNDIKLEDERVLIEPAIGKDVTAIDMGDRYLVAKTDPITFATDRIGWYVVQVNANDIATSGARPKWFLVTALLPEKDTDKELISEIWTDLEESLDSIGCCLCGGHTEVTVGLDRPILVGQMLGEVGKNSFVHKEETTVGDRVLMTKGIPVEGTALMAMEKNETLSEAFSDKELREAENYLERPGISVVKEAMAACEAGGIQAMHDPTEGGISTGLWELGKATGLGMRIEEKNIVKLEPGQSFCQHFDVDMLGMISSGTLLLCVEPEKAMDIQKAILEEGIECRDIGEMLPEKEGLKLIREDGSEIDMPIYVQDEITKVL